MTEQCVRIRQAERPPEDGNEESRVWRLRIRVSQHRRHEPQPQDALDLPVNILVLRDTTSRLSGHVTASHFGSGCCSATGASAHESGTVIDGAAGGDGVDRGDRKQARVAYWGGPYHFSLGKLYGVIACKI